MITVRKAKDSDATALYDLLGQVLLVHHNIRPDLFRASGAKHDIDEIKLMIANSANPIFVAVDDTDYPVGHCMCMVQSEKHPNGVPHKTLHIDDLCIDEAHRSQGIGKLLCDYAMDYAKKIGCYNVTLNVWEGNDNAKTFYDNLGFEPYRTSLERIL